MTVITPKFLNANVAERALDLVVTGIFYSSQMKDVLNKHMGHIVVLVPSIKVVPAGADRNVQTVLPFLLATRDIGDKSQWTSPYDKIALNKGTQLWYDRNADGATDCQPHLLYLGDTPYWGGVKRHGIVVACSGVQSFFDQMLSGMVADAIKAFARFEFETSEDKLQKRAFLT